MVDVVLGFRYDRLSFEGKSFLGVFVADVITRDGIMTSINQTLLSKCLLFATVCTGNSNSYESIPLPDSVRGLKSVSTSGVNRKWRAVVLVRREVREMRWKSLEKGVLDGGARAF